MKTLIATTLWIIGLLLISWQTNGIVAIALLIMFWASNIENAHREHVLFKRKSESEDDKAI
jgi:hypothetical protein